MLPVIIVMADNPVYRVLKDSTRQEIIKLIGEKKRASYTDIRNHLGISTGKLNYHLRYLSEFIDKTDGQYVLNDRGQQLETLLKDYPKNRENEHEGLSRSFFRPIGWITLAIFAVSLYFGAIEQSLTIQFISIILLMVSVFFFYSSIELEFNLLEFISILILSIIVAILSFQLNLNITYAQTTASVIVAFPYLIMGIILFGSLLPWSMSDRKRLLVTVAGVLYPTLASPGFMIGIIVESAPEKYTPFAAPIALPVILFIESVVAILLLKSYKRIVPTYSGT